MKGMNNTNAAREIKVFGIVQGVGFRPFVYQLAQKHGLTGWVLNNSQGVAIHWEGWEQNIEGALNELLTLPPPLAKITGHTCQDAELQGYSSFFIQQSYAQEDRKVLIPPDVGTCTDCMNELLDSTDRRFAYPFTNCTNCGPRFTIIQNVPYDRHYTTMAQFSMCPQCQKEYEDPGNRRFHAQPNACPVCGPKMELLDSRGVVIHGNICNPLEMGKIVAIKGLGGFHLACNALDKEAVSRLRDRKKRDAKPFALMAADLQTVRHYCHLSVKEEEHLVSPARPIVILEQKDTAKLSPGINPGLDSLGVMLPYTPLHQLLFSQKIRLLVMTSANLSSNPLVTENHEALEQLKDIADYFIIHDRDIENPCDDSVGTVVGERWQFIRRSRGYVPLPIQLKRKLKPLLACGGNLKNTFALAKDERVFLSQHWGDLDNYLNYEKYEKAVPKMISLLGIKPRLIVHDLHPDYQTTCYAGEMSERWDVPLVAVQHHHAHMVSCMADNDLGKEVMAVVCDGTGFGMDGGIWGFEFLYGDYGGFKRIGHLEYIPLPGGVASIKRPDRMAFSFLISTLGEKIKDHTASLLPGLSQQEQEILSVQIKRGINSPFTSSCGRLFDAAAALLGICQENKYEGQGPMEMETKARHYMGNVRKPYSIQLKEKSGNSFDLDTSPLWEEMVSDLLAKKDISRLAYKFHLTVARSIRDGVVYMAEKTGSDQVVLSGGVFQNKLLTVMVEELVSNEKIKVYRHRQVPPNDGGISLGQALIGDEVQRKCV